MHAVFGRANVRGRGDSRADLVNDGSVQELAQQGKVPELGASFS
jgi:hypothetical protein